MKTLTKTIGLTRMSVAVLFLLLAAGNVSAQQYLSQEGRMLDANPRVGSFGYNSRVNMDVVMPRANLYITGNVRGGKSFQGLVPYGGADEFSGTLGSSALSNFYRDSTGVSDLGSGFSSAGQPYFDPSRQTTHRIGSQVMRSDQYYQQTGVAPVGGSLLMSGTNNLLSQRPLSRSYNSLPATGAAVPNYYESRISSGQVPTGIPLEGSAELGKPFGITQLAKPSPLKLKPEMLGGLDSEDRIKSMIPSSTENKSQTEQQPAEPLVDEGPGYYLRLQQQWQQQQSQLPPTGVQGIDKTADQNALSDQNATTDQTADSSALTTGTATQQPAQTTGDMGTISGIAAAPPLGSLMVGKESVNQIRERNLNRYLIKAETYLREGKYYLAANAFGDAAFYNPKDPVMYLGKSHALFGAGEYMSSAYYLDKALNLRPDLSSKQLDIKQLFPDEATFQKRYDELNTFYEQSVQPMLLFLKGYIEFQTGELDKARQSLTEVSKLLPHQQSIQYLLDALNAGGAAAAGAGAGSIPAIP